MSGEETNNNNPSAAANEQEREELFHGRLNFYFVPVNPNSVQQNLPNPHFFIPGEGTDPDALNELAYLPDVPSDFGEEIPFSRYFREVMRERTTTFSLEVRIPFRRQPNSDGEVAENAGEIRENVNVQEENQHEPTRYNLRPRINRQSYNTSQQRRTTSQRNSNNPSTAAADPTPLSIFRRLLSSSGLLDSVNIPPEDDLAFIDFIFNLLQNHFSSDGVFIGRNANPPASEDAVGNLKKVLCQEKENCVICLEEMNNSDSGSDPLTLLEMPCNHIFHENCLKVWLKQSNQCPNCRYEILTDNQEYNLVVERKMNERKIKTTSKNDKKRPCEESTDSSSNKEKLIKLD